MTSITKEFVTEPHNHNSCISDALKRAKALCERKGLRLTAQRRQVLELIWQGHRPIGAYELLEAMRNDGTRAAPPTVYRALDFLLANGLIHRIESLNAYVGCNHPGTPHQGQFLVCSDCHHVAELEDTTITRQVCDSARKVGFDVEQQTVEVRGRCVNCREKISE